jgi:ATP-dependent Clp protease ATP-binding subunit ClpA
LVDQAVVPRLERCQNRQTIEPAANERAVELGGRSAMAAPCPTRHPPARGNCVKSSLEGSEHVTTRDLQAVVAEREHLPCAISKPAAPATTAGQPRAQLQRAVVGQDPAIRTIARTIAKSQLAWATTPSPAGRSAVGPPASAKPKPPKP